MNDSPITDKLSRPIHDLRISVIDRCNFRCTYCMPKEDADTPYSFISKDKWLTYDEIYRLSKLFLHLGVKKFRLTGGEPLLRPGITQLVAKLSTLPGIDDLALTTNGALLSKFAIPLKESGLKRLTVSLDTLDSRIFSQMSGTKSGLNDILNGLEIASQIGFKEIKINVVIQKGVNDHQIMQMVDFFKGSGHIIRFIEYMDVGNCNHWDLKYVVPSKKIVDKIHRTYPLEPIGHNYFGEVAKRYRYLDGDGEIGFISSITQPFCQSCTRIRLTTDGQLITCLFASQGQSVKDLLRSKASDEEILAIIRQVWQKRDDQYSKLRMSPHINASSTKKLEMFHIGG